MKKNKEYLFSVRKSDFIIQTFKSGGPGGQHQNKTDSGVRIIHKESGASAESRSDRSQHRNKKIALQRLVHSGKFKLWLNRKAKEVISGKTLDKIVEEMMATENIKIEVKNDRGEWEEKNVDF